MEPKLILMDLDDTLLRTDRSISNKTLKILQQCRDLGLFLGFATARSETNSQAYIDAIKPDVIISSAGAMIRYQHEIIYSSMFSSSETEEMIRTAMSHLSSDYEITVDTKDTHYWNYKVKPEGWGEIVHTDFKDFREEALKICIRIDDPGVASELSRKFPDAECIHFSRTPWYLFMKKNHSKALGVQKLIGHADFGVQNIIAFGDDYSDLEMLQLCGKGIAMGNAVEALKEIADEITDTNDNDGIAKWIQARILK